MLLPPPARHPLQQPGQRHPLRLPPVQDRFHQFRCQQRQPQQGAQIPSLDLLPRRHFTDAGVAPLVQQLLGNRCLFPTLRQPALIMPFALSK